MVTKTFRLALVAGVLWLADPSSGQWVDFTDDTAGRLNIAPIGVGDTQEKDIAVGDFNRDGWDDVVVVRKTPFSVIGPQSDVLLMNENGVLVNRTSTLAPGFLSALTDARDVFVVDLDGDTWDDLIIANTFEQQPKLYRNLGEDGDGVWQGFADESASRLPTIVPAAALQFCAVWAADVTGDNAPDIYFSNYSGTTDVLLINDGNGFFTDETASRLRSENFGDYSAVAFGTSAQIHDVDNDGDRDIIKISTLFAVAPWDETGIFILFNDGNGFFNRRPFQSIAPAIDPYMFCLGDLNNDSMLDVFFQHDSADRVRLATGLTVDGPIAYSSGTNVASSRLSGFGGNVKMADIDNDGDLDVGVSAVDTDIANCTGGEATEFALLRNEGIGSGTITDPYTGVTLPWHQRSFDIAFLDIDNDGLLDMFFGNCTGYTVQMQVCTEAVADSPACALPLRISVPGGAPQQIAPGGPNFIAVMIADDLETLVPGSATLHYRFDGGAVQTTALTDLGGGTHQARLPGAGCTDSPELYFSALGDGGSTVFDPPDAPATVYTPAVGVLTLVLDNDFEPDAQGWTVGDPSDDATTGLWVRGDPIATAAQPEDDHTPSGTMAFFTGQGTAGGMTGENDVDGGKTTLLTPLFDLSSMPDVTIRYWRWYSNDQGSSPNADTFVVEISNDGGSNWFNVETIGPSGLGTSGGWIQHVFAVSDVVVPTNQVRMRFIASDFGPGSIIEAAIDDFVIDEFGCQIVKGDFNLDTVIDLADHKVFLDCLSGPGQSPLPTAPVSANECVNIFDFNGDNDVDEDDFARMQSQIGG